VEKDMLKKKYHFLVKMQYWAFSLH